MKYRKILTGLFLTVLISISQMGCSTQKDSSNYNKEVVAKNLTSKVVADNENYNLKWDDKAQCVLLEDKKTGKIWSDILYDAYLAGSSSANAKSALTITFVNENNMSWETVSSVAELQSGGKIVCEEIKDGVCVTYYFDRLEIAVPVTYELRNDSVAVSVNGADIQEGDTIYKLVSVGMTPYFCSASDDNADNYLFVPAGSGALMYTTENADGTRKFSGEVYGEDITRRKIKSIADDEKLRLPVFGAKDGDTAILGVIENGAGAAFIEAQAGYARLGYSQVGATFYFRGYDTFRHGTYATGNAVITRTSEDCSTQKMTVAYYPLQNEDADYNGMAECYRNYLIESEQLDKSKVNASAYSVSFLGGTTVAESFIGIPYNDLHALTKYEYAQKILSDLTKDNGIVPITRMMNYGDNGLLPGTIAGGSKYDSVYGTKKQLESLQEYCQEKNTILFWDFDLIRYSKSGNGFAYNSDCAETAIHYQAEQYPVTPIRLFDEENPYRILGRDSLTDAMQKALKKAEKYNHTGVSFSTLGEYAYSDYDDEKYAVRTEIEKDVSNLLNQAGEKNTVGVSGANSYAACASDILFDVPLGYGAYDVLDEHIPFYQMVFHSYKAMYSSAINLAEDAQKEIMLSAASGVGLGFTLISEYVPESNDIGNYKLYGTVYENNIELIHQALNNQNYREFYEKTANSIITKYELLENGVSATYFENGMVLYANHNSEKVNSPIGELDAYMFKVQ